MSEEKAEYNPGQAAKREKYWDELSVEEKLERTRWVVNTRTSMLERRVESLARRLAQLEAHAHVGDKVVVPLRDTHTYGEAMVGDTPRVGGKEWF